MDANGWNQRRTSIASKVTDCRHTLAIYCETELFCVWLESEARNVLGARRWSLAGLTVSRARRAAISLQIEAWSALDASSRVGLVALQTLRGVGAL